MKARSTTGLFILIVAIFSCNNDESLSIPAIQGLSLYWDHEVFGDEGRRLRFEATTTDQFGNDYDLEFSASVVDKSITARLIKSVDNGKCPFFPTPGKGGNDPNTCNASGEFYLADKELGPGVYSLKIIMPAFEVTSELTVTDEKVTLQIPINSYINCATENVYPIPPNLLFGSIVYKGSDNTTDANDFLSKLSDLGLIQTTVPNYPYRHLTVDESGNPPKSEWEPDNHSIGFLYKLTDTDFKTVFETSKQYFNQSNLNIYLYTSNGDQAFLDKADGITVVYSK